MSVVFLIRLLFFENAESSQPVQPRKPPQVRVVAVWRATISHGLELTGSVEPYRVAHLASPAEGPVLDLRVREGDRVRAGEALLGIGRREGVDALIASLREELASEEENLRRTRHLVESKVIADEQLERASSTVEKVRAQLIKAEEAALDYAVTAPWDGVVARLLVREGQFVGPRVALLEIYDPSSLTIRAAVPERQAARIAATMHVEVRLDAFPDEILSGRILRAYPYLDPRLRSRTVEIALDREFDLLPGMFARLRILMETVDQAVVVPLEAIVLRPEGPVVFVVENGKAFRRSVETGIEEGNRLQIVAGLDPGDLVIVAGKEQLTHGAAVNLAGEADAGKGKAENGDSSAGQRLDGESGRP